MKPFVTQDKIVIPFPLEQAKCWTRRAMETACWLISLGLLAASAGLFAIGVLAWLVTGSELPMVAGFAGALLLGLAGLWQLLHRLDRAARQLRRETPETGASTVQGS